MCHLTGAKINPVRIGIMANNFNSKKVKSLLRRFSVFQSWRIGEPPFDHRPDFYSEDDVNSLLDEVASCLGEYALFLDGDVKQNGSCESHSKHVGSIPPNVQFVSADDLFKRSPEMAKKLQEALINGINKSESESSTSGIVENSVGVPEVVDIIPDSSKRSSTMVDKPSTVSVAPSGRPAAKGISAAFTDNTPFIIEES